MVVGATKGGRQVLVADDELAFRQLPDSKRVFFNQGLGGLSRVRVMASQQLKEVPQN